MRKLFQFVIPQNRCFKRQTVTDDSLKKSPDFFQFSPRQNHAKTLPAPGVWMMRRNVPLTSDDEFGCPP